MIAGIGLATGGALVASCAPQQVTDIEKQVADFITQVQAAVRAACAQVGVLVPTANSVIAIVQAIVGSTNPAVITAAVISQVISEIIAAGCPSTPPTPGASSGMVVRGVPVAFY